jgi:hypothetical protein
MSFLASLDALPPNDAASRNGLFFQQLHTDWRTLFAELRASRPVLQLPGLVVLANWADVIDMLSRNGIFQVTYGPHMDPSVGPFMMGRDDTELNWRDKSVMRTLLQWAICLAYAPCRRMWPPPRWPPVSRTARWTWSKPSAAWCHYELSKPASASPGQTMPPCSAGPAPRKPTCSII